MPKHFHVHAGLAGCTPCYTATYPTWFGAMSGMVWYKRYCESGVEHNHRLFIGNAKSGRYDACHEDAGVDYVEIAECHEVGCNPADDYPDCDNCERSCIVVDGLGSCQRGD